MTNLERYIKGKGLNIKKISERTGYTQVYILRCIQERKINIQMATAISKVLKIELDHFYELLEVDL